MRDEPRLTGGRRLGAGLVVAVAAAGFVTPVRKAIDDTRLVRSEIVQITADAQLARFQCVREAMAAVPDRPTYVVPTSELPGAEWYQRALELGFGEVPFVAERAEAEQVLELVEVADGSGACGDLDVRVHPL